MGSDLIIQRSLRSELRVLWVMAHKEWLIFRRYPAWVMGYIIWPLIFPLGAIFTARALSGPDARALPAFAALAGTDNYVGFIVIGLTVYAWINITLWEVGFHLRNEQMRGTLESNWLCPTWRFSLLLGPSLTKLATSLCFLSLAIAEYHLFFGVPMLAGNPTLFLLVLLLVIPSIYGIGIAFGSLVIRFQEAHTMVFLVRGIFMVFTGASYPLAVLPDWMQTVATWLPLTYAIQSIRAISLQGAGLSEIAADLRMLAFFALFMPVLGYLLFRFTERQARRTGTLGHY